MESDSSSDFDSYGVVNETQPLLYESSTSSDSDDGLIRELERRSRNPRIFRQRPDNFIIWSEQEFFMRFRLKKATVLMILTAIQDRLEYNVNVNRNCAVTPRNQLLLTLRFYATGNMLIAIGDFSGVHKATASRIIKKVTDAITSLTETYIHMPRNQDEVTCRQMGFYNIARFPKIIGAIDCTHVRIQSPGGNNAEYFRNRKGYFSLNTQVVGDSSLRILDIVARWPGSAHDQTIFNNSRIHARLEGGEFTDNILLGDSGYALTKYLITPLLHPVTPGEHLFNEAQIRSRNPIERLFGVWKRRFPVLSIGIRLSIETVQAVIIACSVLHNVAIHENENQPPDDPNIMVPIIEENEDIQLEEMQGQREFRHPFITYFSELN